MRHVPFSSFFKSLNLPSALSATYINKLCGSEEYNEVLHRAKFKLPDEIIVQLLSDIVSNGFEVKNAVEVEEEMPDPKDIVFYAVTLSASDKESVLVTGNGKHFPSKPFVLTPLELIQIMEEK